MLEYLIELAENEMPINLGSLINTFPVYDESFKYKEYVAFRSDTYGAWIIFEIENVQYYVFFISTESWNIYDDNSKLFDPYTEKDDIIITRIEKHSNHDKIFSNTKFCIK